MIIKVVKMRSVQIAYGKFQKKILRIVYIQIYHFETYSICTFPCHKSIENMF